MVATSTYQVIQLGVVADLDPVESSGFSENAGAIVNMTFGSTADPLYDHISTLSPVG